MLNDFQAERSQQEVNQQRHRAEDRFRAAIQCAPMAMIMVDVQGRIVFANAEAERIFGYRHDELLSLPIEVLVPEQFRADHPRLCSAYFEESQARRMGAGRDLFGVRKDGSSIQVEIGLSPLETDEGPLVLATIADITERKRAEAALRESEERLRLAQQAAGIGAFEWNIPTGLNVWTPELEAMYGLAPGEFGRSQSSWEQLVHPNDRAAAIECVNVALRTGEPVTGEWRIIRPDGSVRWLHGRFQVFRDAMGNPERLAGVNIDITDRKRAEAERQKFVSLANGSSEFIGMCDRDFQPFYVNAAGMQMVGLENIEAARCVKVQDCFFPEDQPFITEHFFPRVLRDGHGEIEIRFRHFRTGEPIWMLYNVFNIHDASGEVVGWATVSRNIHDRKLAEAALQEREEQLRMFIEHSPVALAMFDRQMRYLHASRRWHSDLNVKQGELRGQSHYEVFPEISETWKEIHRRALAGEVLRAEEDRFERADGSVQWLRWEVRPWYDAGGAVGGILIFSEEITRRRLAEASLRRAERLVSLNTLTAGLSHEIYNPLSAAWNSSHAALRASSDPELKDVLDASLRNIVDSIKRCRDIINSLRAFAGGAPFARTPQDLNEIVRNSIRSIAKHSTKVSIEADLAEGLPLVPMDGVAIERVLLNLIHNAIESTNSSVRIAVRTWQDSRYAILSVVDDGPGMSPEVRARAFEPFFTTKQDQGGIGLGMSIAHGIVTRHHGQIDIETQEDKGTSILLRLPLVDE